MLPKRSYISITYALRLYLEDIISATLVLQIDKNKLKKENSDVLNTALRLVDSENIIIIGKNGKRIKGTAYLTKAFRQFKNIRGLRYNEQEIEDEMRKIIKDVKHGELVP